MYFKMMLAPLVLVLSMVVASHSEAQTPNGATCLRETNPKLRIDACTKFIADDRPSKEDLGKAYYFRAWAYYDLELFAKAKDDFSESITYYPRHAYAYSMRSASNAKMYKIDDAISDAATAIQLAPQKAHGYESRCIAYSIVKRWNEALEDCDKAVDLDATSPSAVNQRGIIYFVNGMYEEAIPEFTKALQRKVLPISYLLRAQSYEATGKKDLAIQDFQRVQTLSPNEAKSKAALQRLGAQ